MSKKKYLWIAVLVYAILIFIGSSIPGSRIKAGPPGFDKLIHLFEYLILSALLFVALASGGKRGDLKKYLLLSFFISSLYGVSDEVHQLFVKGRFFEPLDIFMDSVGSFVGSYWGFRVSMRKKETWDVDYKEARRIQEEMKKELVLEGDAKGMRLVAGADVSSEMRSRKQGDRIFAAVVVMDIDTFKVVDSAHHTMKVDFPYIPGLLSFREGPAVIGAFEKLKTLPQAVIFDGQGIAHQRRFGLASHMGVILGIPSVGCAKTRLVGEYNDVGEEKGSRTPLTKDGDLLGYVVRTKSGVKPLFVSPGNLISREAAVDLVLSSVEKYRLPEPVRAAHDLANRLRREFREGEK